MSSRRRLSAVPETPRLALIYVRVSALMGRGGESFMSPDLQEQAARAFCAARGWHVTDVISDIDVSGQGFHRTGLDRALALIEEGQAGALVVYDVSRLGRRMKETLDVIDRVRGMGGVVASVQENFDDSPEGEHLLHTFLSIAHLYGRQVGRRWSQVITRRAELGLWHGSNPPLGYVLRGKGLERDPATHALVTDAFRRYAAGHLVSHIARDITTARGRMLAVTTLKRMLYNPVYTGRVHVGGQVYDGRHEALVDQQTWEKVQRRLQRDRRTPSRHLAVSHSLVGLVVCDHCSGKLQLHVDPPRASRAHDVPRLQCRRRLGGGPDVCAGPGSPAVAKVEEAVLARVEVWISDLRSDSSERAAKQARRARATVDVGRVRRELEKNDAALGRLTVDRARRDITEQAYRLAATDLERAGTALRAQLDAVEDVIDSPRPQGTAKAAQELLTLWPVMTTSEKNRALRQLIREVRVRRAAFYREPFSAEPGGRVQVEWL